MAEHTHDDVRFLDFAERLERFPEGQHVIHLHLSNLRPHHRQEHHFRVVAAHMEHLHSIYTGFSFRMPNDDFFVSFKDADVSVIEAEIDKLRKLFEEDPLIVAENRPPRPGERRREFCTWYRGPQDYATILNLAKSMREEGDKKRRENPQVVIGRQSRQNLSEPIGPEQLARLENSMDTAELSNIATRQFICAIKGPDKVRPVMSELFISIRSLQQQLMPGVEITANKWLFQHLTEFLDRRVLQVLLNWDSGDKVPVSVNINIATLLSEEFLKFDHAFRQRWDRPLVFEVQAMDVFADWSAFRFARDVLRERGYSIALDGINYMALPAFNRQYLGMDLYKLVWSPEMAGDLSEKQDKSILDAIAEIGPNRVILSRCDNDDAIKWGRSVGINLFQGRHPDRLYKATQGPRGVTRL